MPNKDLNKKSSSMFGTSLRFSQEMFKNAEKQVIMKRNDQHDENV